MNALELTDILASGADARVVLQKCGERLCELYYMRRPRGRPASQATLRELEQELQQLADLLPKIEKAAGLERAIEPSDGR